MVTGNFSNDMFVTVPIRTSYNENKTSRVARCRKKKRKKEKKKQKEKEAYIL